MSANQIMTYALSLLVVLCSACYGRLPAVSNTRLNNAFAVSEQVAHAAEKTKTQDMLQKKFYWLFRGAEAKSEGMDSFKNAYFQQLDLENEICPQLDVPQNGHLFLSDSYSVGSVAIYSCDSGYVLAGSMARICQVSLEWTQEEPFCEEVTCPLLDVPTNGSVTLSTTTPGSVANYSCDPGFELTGETELYCLESGKWNGTEPNCTENLWPKGSYGFPAPSKGCPGKLTLGCRFHDNEDVNNKNLFANQHLLKGDYSNDINVCYCVTEESIDSEIEWPPGRYCINRKDDSCPSQFTSGFIFFDDEDDLNKNSKDGNLPDGFYDKDTRVFYCCRDDGSIEDEVVLPTDDDFVLYQYREPGCQRVAGMVSTDVILLFDDEDTFNNNACEDGPYNPGCLNDHMIFMCHYTAEE